MSEDSKVSESQCNEKNSEIYKRINSLAEQVSQIRGGIAVTGFVILFITGGIFYHINYRFSNVERLLHEMKNAKPPYTVEVRDLK